MSDVFICHSSANAQDARDICDRLEAEGITCWIAPRDPVPGIPYGQQLVSAIAHARVVLFVLSADANESGAVLSELELAANRKKIILPVRIEEVAPSASLEFYLRAIHWFDATSRPRDEIWPELLRYVRGLLAQASPAKEAAEAAPKGSVSRAPRHNLPAAVSSFVGRDAELAEVEEFLKASRLVTLCGAGGIGKTTLALRIAMGRLNDYPNGAWLVDLAQIEDATLVAKSFAAVFDLRESANRPILDTLLAYLKSKHLLIVLDSCEHVVAEAARVTETILRGCASVTVLATTRETLGVRGEQIYRVPSLSESDAIALFVDRAKAADSRFGLSGENAPVVAEICRRLDGIALAIELAAARVKMLAVNALADGLNARFDIVTGGSRTALPRQKTLRAMIDWSYDLLGEQERALFRRLAIFAGSFTLYAATEVCASDGVLEAGVLDLLGSLVDKSMVQADFVRDEVRYHLLDSMRAYGHEKLVAQSEFEATALAHASAFLKVAETLESAGETTPDKAWKLKAEPELENWRAALRWAFGSTGDAALGQRLAAALRPVWFTMAPSEGREWIRMGLESVDDSTPTRMLARLEVSDAHLAMLAQQYESAMHAAERALELFAQEDDAQGIALANMFVGAARGMGGELETGAAYLERALDAFRQLGARRAIGGTLVYLGIVKLSSGDVSAPRALFGEALELLESIGAARPAAHVALSLAELEYRAGDAVAAARLGTQALTAERALNDLDAVTFDLCNLSAYLVALGRWEEARTHAREALSLALDRQIASATIWALQHLAAISALRPSRRVAAASEGRSRAAQLIGFVDSRLTDFKMRRDFTEQTEYERILAALDGEGSRHQEEGRVWTEARAAEEARLI